MDRRLMLHDILLNICPNVYFNPPENVKLKYPCILYKRSNARTNYADNKTYQFMIRYQITIIDKDPDTSLIDKVKDLPYCTFDRHYTNSNLNHDVFDIYY